MSIYNFQENAKSTPIKGALAEYLQSGIAAPIVVSDEFPEVLWPWRHLRSLVLDKSTREGVVILKGTLVGLLGQMGYFNSDEKYYPLVDNTGLGIGSIPVGISQTTGDVLTAPVGNGYMAYGDTAIGTMIPANSGAGATYNYTSYDVELETMTVDGTIVTSTSTTYALPAVRPLGISMTNMHQDIRGRNLSYKSPAGKSFSVYTRGYVDVPFINWAKLATGSVGTASGNMRDHAVYAAIRDLGAFAYSNSGTDYAQDGDFLMSDDYGRFMISSNTTLGLYEVGKLIAVDYRYPKNLTNYVDTALGSGLTGTVTGGVPTGLYLFAYYTLVALGLTPTIKDVVAKVKEGCFGMAKIQLMLS